MNSHKRFLDVEKVNSSDMVLEDRGLSEEQRRRFREENPFLYRIISDGAEQIAPHDVKRKEAIVGLVTDVLRIRISAGDRVRMESGGDKIAEVSSYQDPLPFPEPVTG